MQWLKRAVFIGLLCLPTAFAVADQVCVGYDAQGKCTGWVDSGNGGYTPVIPTLPSPGSQPGSSCVCAGYTANGSCNYYINCSQ